jgi:hypothetical protein
MLKRVPIHPFAFAIFPILALLSYNITEVPPRVALRSLVISLIATASIFLLLSLITHKWQKAGLTTTLLLIMFYSYGQVYELLQAHPILGINLGRHRYLVIIYATIIIVTLWLIYFKSTDYSISTQILNIVGIFLLVYPVIKVANYSYRTTVTEQRLASNPLNIATSILTKPKKLPDVYFIVIDGYTRGNAFLNDLKFDNSAFLNELSSMGFYIASCSLTNYGSTRESLTATLNMDYIPTLISEIQAQGFTQSDDVWMLLKQSRVRYLLETMGYKTVAFDSGFEWSRMRDADIYLTYSGVPYEMQALQPFEAMLIRSSALLIWSDSTYKSLLTQASTIFKTTNTEFEDHIDRQRYILDELPRIPSYPGPKFVFAHILIPHPPFVFLPNGDIQTDPRFYSNPGYGPVTGAIQMQGYLNQVQFINNRMPAILDTIIEKSSVPPIIVLMGDHGATFVDHYMILNALYVPENGKQKLYPSITPVNSFRVIFDTVFGTNFGLLPDISHAGNTPVPETSPECIQ